MSPETSWRTLPLCCVRGKCNNTNHGSYGLQDVYVWSDEMSREESHVQAMLTNGRWSPDGIQTAYAPNENICGIFRICVDCSHEIDALQTQISQAVAQRWRPSSYWSLQDASPVAGRFQLLDEGQLSDSRIKLSELQSRLGDSYLRSIAIRTGRLENSFINAKLLLPVAILEDESIPPSQLLYALGDWSIGVMEWLVQCYAIISRSKQGLAPMHPLYSDHDGCFGIHMIALSRVRRSQLGKCCDKVKALLCKHAASGDGSHGRLHLTDDEQGTVNT